MNSPSPYGYPSASVRRRRRPRRSSRWSCLLGCLLPICLGCVVLAVPLVLLSPPADILLLGVDARPGQGFLTRTDSIMLVNINPPTLDVTLLSIPRDVFIRVPGYGDQRINTINVLGEQDAPGSGPNLLKESFKESFGVDVDHVVRLDFDGFRALIDAVGGVDVDVPKLIIDYEYPTEEGGIMTVQFEPGKQHMDGERALQYARTRHQDDDYQRAARQQQVIDALLKKLANPLSVPYWPRFLQALSTYADSDMNTWDMLRLAPAAVLGWPGREQRVVQREDLIPGAGEYAIPNYDALNPWIAARYD